MRYSLQCNVVYGDKTCRIYISVIIPQLNIMFNCDRNHFFSPSIIIIITGLLGFKKRGKIPIIFVCARTT